MSNENIKTNNIDKIFAGKTYYNPSIDKTIIFNDGNYLILEKGIISLNKHSNKNIEMVATTPVIIAIGNYNSIVDCLDLFDQSNSIYLNNYHKILSTEQYNSFLLGYICLYEVEPIIIYRDISMVANEILCATNNEGCLRPGEIAGGNYDFL